MARIGRFSGRLNLAAIGLAGVGLTAGLALLGEAKTVTVTFATWAVKAETDELTKFIFPRFEAANPGIRVKLIQTTDHVMTMINMMAAGVAPDLIQVEEPMMDYFGQCGQLLDLSAYMKRDKLRLDDYVDIKAGKTYWDATPIGLPYHAVTTAVYYNKALLAQAGLNEPDKAWDWQAFSDMAAKLTKDANNDGKPEVHGSLLHEWECIWGPFMWSNGGFIYDKQMSPTKVTIASPQAVQAVQFLQDLLYKSRAALRGTSWDGGVQNFAKGKVAMVNEGSWNVPTLRQGIKSFDWDVQLLPRSPYTKRTSARIAMGAASVWKGSKHKDAAWRLLKFLVTSEFVQRTKARAALFAPLTVEQASWPEFYPTSLKPRSAGSVFHASLEDAYVQTVYPTTKSADMVTALMQKILDNKTSVSDGLKKLQQPLEVELNKVLQRRRR